MSLSAPFDKTPPECPVMAGEVPNLVASVDNSGSPLAIGKLMVAVANVAMANVKDGLSVDGQVVNGNSGSDFVLLTAQTNPAENGLYLTDVSAPPYTFTGDVKFGQGVKATHGTTYGGRIFKRVSATKFEIVPLGYDNTAPTAGTV